MRTRTIATIVFLIVVFVAIIALGWRHRGPNSFQAEFQPGGNVNLDLSVGGFTIEGTAENQIRVEVDPSDAPYVHSEMHINGNSARVSLEGPNDNFHATIYVPQRSNLTVTQTVGELRIRNIEGDKDLGLNIGDLKVQVPDPAAVKSVTANVRIGDVHAIPWHRGHGGFFPSFHAQGQGAYSIKASVDIGKIELSE